MAEDYLQHYGVLGMRWGVRHDKKYQEGLGRIKAKKGSAEYKKQKAKLRLETANRLYSKNSTEANNRIVNRNTRGTLGMSFLLGSYGAMRYDQMRAKGYSKGSSAVSGLLSNWGNNMTYQVPSLIEYGRNRMARTEKGRKIQGDIRNKVSSGKNKISQRIHR